MNAGFDENQTELGVLVLAVSLQVLAHRDSLAISIRVVIRFRGEYNSNTYLLDQHVEVLWDFWGKACIDHSVSLETKQRLYCTGWKRSTSDRELCCGLERVQNQAVKPYHWTSGF